MPVAITVRSTVPAAQMICELDCEVIAGGVVHWALEENPKTKLKNKTSKNFGIAGDKDTTLRIVEGCSIMFPRQ